jgi:hypothetical protein
MPRCASTLVMDMLRQHKSIMSADELFAFGAKERDYFHRQAFGSDDGDHLSDSAMKSSEAVFKYLDACQGKAYLAQRALAFKLLDFQSPAAWTWVCQRAHLIVYIERDNPLEALVSERYGHIINSWHARSKEQARAYQVEQHLQGPLEVYPEDFLRWMRRKELLEGVLDGRSNVVRFKYSYIASMPADTASELVSTMGIEEGLGGVQVPQVKIAIKPIWERVKNYRELWKQFHNTAYSYCFPTPIVKVLGSTAP